MFVSRDSPNLAKTKLLFLLLFLQLNRKMATASGIVVSKEYAYVLLTALATAFQVGT